jgi:hypothetical protein
MTYHETVVSRDDGTAIGRIETRGLNYYATSKHDRVIARFRAYGDAKSYLLARDLRCTAPGEPRS